MTESAETETTANPDEQEPEATNWERQPSEEGYVFVDSNGRRLEVLPQTGDDWSAELYHKFGATCIGREDTEDKILARLYERGTLSPSDL